jgi:lysine 2,3-aminomutase
MLKKHSSAVPIYVNTHFNHPREITPESKKACGMLVDSGIPVGNQSVLLRGVNDDPLVMRELVQGLVNMRVRPYYIYQADNVKGTNHFKTKIQTGLDIYRAIRGFTSGLCVPAYVIDAPGGGGKIPVLPEYVIERTPEKIVLKNYEGKIFTYNEVNYTSVDDTSGQRNEKFGPKKEED